MSWAATFLLDTYSSNEACSSADTECMLWLFYVSLGSLVVHFSPAGLILKDLWGFRISPAPFEFYVLSSYLSCVNANEAERKPVCEGGGESL